MDLITLKINSFMHHNIVHSFFKLYVFHIFKHRYISQFSEFKSQNFLRTFQWRQFSTTFINVSKTLILMKQIQYQH